MNEASVEDRADMFTHPWDPKEPRKATKHHYQQKNTETERQMQQMQENTDYSYCEVKLDPWSCGKRKKLSVRCWWFNHDHKHASMIWENIL